MVHLSRADKNDVILYVILTQTFPNQPNCLNKLRSFDTFRWVDISQCLFVYTCARNCYKSILWKPLHTTLHGKPVALVRTKKYFLPFNYYIIIICVVFQSRSDCMYKIYFVVNILYVHIFCYWPWLLTYLEDDPVNSCYRSSYTKLPIYNISRSLTFFLWSHLFNIST